jgi:YVTN family beta-propeller protein
MEVERLDELRLAAIEARVDAELAIGRHAELVPELEVLAVVQPTRERIVAQLMLALYRSGRQSDALAVYRRARATLVDQLGLEPGPELHGREAAILAHDPGLDLAAPGAADTRAPSRSPRAEPMPAPSQPPRSGRRPLRAALAVTSVVLVAVIATIAVLLSSSTHRRLALSAEGAGALDPASGRVLTSVEVGADPAGITSAGGRVWVINGGDGTLTRIDSRDSGHVDQTVKVGSAPVGVTGGFGAVWVANSQSSTVSRVDIVTGEVVQTIAGASRPIAIAAGEGAVWVADAGSSAMVEIQPASGAAERTIRLSDQPGGVAVGLHSVWVTEPLVRRLVRIDSRTGAITAEVDVGGGAGPVAIGGGAVWVLNRLDGTLSRIDPQTEAVTSTAPVGDAPRDVAASDAGVYVADERGVTAVDPDTGAVRRRFTFAASATAVTLVGRIPWVATGTPIGRGHRGGTLRVVGDDALTAFDPARSTFAHPSLWHATGDGLTAVTEAAGTAQLVPDLAIAIPRPTSAGLIYRFRLRPGIRYSTGVFVRASDVRRGLERVFTANSEFADELTALRGAAACTPRHCDLAAGVVTDDRAGTVELRLIRPDPLLLFNISEPDARPVPPGTAPRIEPRTAVPSTGPYKVGRFVPGRELDLVRNPFFRPWSVAAQPDPYPDRIRYRIIRNADARVAAVLHGRADLAFDVGPASDLAQVRARYAPQVKRHLAPLVVYATINVLRPPFDDVRVRRALDLALDRRAVVDAFGGTDLATPTCQVLPPTIPGHVPYCPRTTGPKDGAWHGTALQAARALVRASGTRGIRADFVGWTGDASTAVVAPVLTQTMRRLGYRSRPVLIHDLGRFAARLSAGAFALSQATWTSDIPDASQFLPEFVACHNHNPRDPPRNTNAGGYCNHALDRVMASAAAAGARDPSAGNRLWARADRLAIDDAAIVPMVDLAGIELLSRRTGHFTLDADSLPRADQLWVR